MGPSRQAAIPSPSQSDVDFQDLIWKPYVSNLKHKTHNPTPSRRRQSGSAGLPCGRLMRYIIDLRSGGRQPKCAPPHFHLQVCFVFSRL